MSNDRDLHLCHLIMQIRTWGFLTSGTWISSPISSMSKFSKSLIFIIHEIPSGISFWIPWIGGSQILELVVRLKQLPRQTKVGGPHNNFETMPHDVGPLGTKMTKTVNNPELSPLSSTFLWFHRPLWSVLFFCSHDSWQRSCLVLLYSHSERFVLKV